MMNRGIYSKKNTQIALIIAYIEEITRVITDAF